MKILCAIVAVGFLALSANGCSSSSSAQAMEVESVDIPVGIIIDFMMLTPNRVLMNTQTDTQAGSLFDVWVYDIPSDTASLLMEDASYLTDDNLVWRNQTFLQAPSVHTNPANGSTVWITDGTLANTRMLIDLSTDPAVSVQLRDASVSGDRLILNVSEFTDATDVFAPRLVIVPLQ